MTYLGSPPASQAFAPGTDTFNGDGTTVAFALSRNVATVNDILVIVNNVEQQPSNYTVSGSTLTFSPAPSAGTNNIYVRYLSTNLQTIAPQQGSVYPASLSTPNALYWDTSGNVGVGTTTPGTRVDAYASGTTSTILRTRNDTVAVYLDANSSYSYLNTFTNHPMLFGTNNTERMRIDSSGNVGIGIISTNGFWGSTNTDAKVNIAYSSSGTTFDTAIKGLVLQNTNTTTSNTTSLIFGTQNTGGTGIAQAAIYSINGTRGGAFNSGQLGFSYANSSGVLTEAMRIDSSGNLLVGTTSSTNSAKVTAVSSSTSSAYQMMMNNTDTGTGNQISMDIYRNSTRVGYITTTNTTTSFTSISDYRLKKDVVPMTNALAAVAQLKPCRYKWKVDGSDGQGFIAHELQAVVPDCVFGEKDEVNEDGSIKPQGIDTSFLVATLTAAIQELKAELDVCKAEIAALKGV